MAKPRRPKRRKTKTPAARRRTPARARAPRTSDAALRAEIVTLREQQAATAEILRVISSSPNDVQPVFDAIASSATRLCDATFCIVFRFDGELITVAADDGRSPGTLDVIRAVYPSPPGRQGIAAQAILQRRVISIADAQNSAEFSHSTERARAIGYRAILSVPMLRGDAAIGAINVARLEAIPFTDTQVELLKTFAEQAVIAIENVRLFTELQTSNRELTTALDQQTATGDILRAISRSQTDVQPVFDAIVTSAQRLLNGHSAMVARIVGDELHLAAFTRTDDAGDDAMRRSFPRRLPEQPHHAQAVRELAPVVVADVATDERFDHLRNVVRVRGVRSLVTVPLVREGRAIGIINVTRPESGSFSADEIALLQTFAEQAVIAIENVRLFTELQASNHELTTSLAQQTATAEILRVISRSRTDVQPVFDAIVVNARRLLNGLASLVLLLVDDQLHLAAFTTTNEEGDRTLKELYPRPLAEVPHHARAVRDMRPVVISDVENEEEFQPWRTLARARGFRAFVTVPMLREGRAIGIFTVSRGEAGLFARDEIALLQTFADQAVIAIENVRLFTELQASNRELTTALDTQTATSEILRVISRSQTDVQPVFDAIVDSAVRLLGAYTGVLTRIEGDQIALAALTSTDDAAAAAHRALFPRALHSVGAPAQAMRDRAPINIADAHTDPRVSEAGRAFARVRGYRSQVVVPMLRHDEPVGTIAVTRREPGGFTDDEIVLLQTFADQAVIAIENARLLSELQARTQDLTRSVDQLTALGEVGQAVSSSLDVDTVLTTIVGRAVQLAGADGGTLYEYDETAQAFELRATTNVDDQVRKLQRTSRLRLGEGAVGIAGQAREPIQIPDITIEGAYDSRLREALLRAGTRALLAVPLLREERILGGLVVSRRTPGEFAPEVVSVLKTFATQSALAIQNARLFREIEAKSRELEVASQHKSEFLANMSHELRTPLNAVIGFSEVLLERMFGEVNDKQAEYLGDILTSAQHLLSLINDILDLSKIEAGRMELDASEFDLPTAIDNALTLVRERAGRRGIALERTIDARLGQVHADERKIKQVLLNLLSNALKFTPEGGRVDVCAGLADGFAEIAVSDTGVGIAPADHAAVFEEFRQVGSADKKSEGTGLGLSLSKRFIELHGGRIRLESQIGAGSTFTFTLPLKETTPAGS